MFSGKICRGNILIFQSWDTESPQSGRCIRRKYKTTNIESNNGVIRLNEKIQRAFLQYSTIFVKPHRIDNCAVTFLNNLHQNRSKIKFVNTIAFCTVKPVMIWHNTIMRIIVSTVMTNTIRVRHARQEEHRMGNEKTIVYVALVLLVVYRFKKKYIYVKTRRRLSCIKFIVFVVTVEYHPENRVRRKLFNWWKNLYNSAQIFIET